MLRKLIVPFTLTLAIAAAGAVPAIAAAGEPTPHQIYLATQAGQLAQAEQMVSEVLAAHPRSGKAHFIAAEVYARARDSGTARRELATAESLEPGLPFADPRSVAELRAELSGNGLQRRVPAYGMPVYGHPRSAVPWGLILLILVALVIVFTLVRRRAQAMAGYGRYPGGVPMSGMPPPGMGPVGPGGYPYGYGGGTGSGLMGGIATGLAVGAGVAAGEALTNRLLGGGAGGGEIPAANAGEFVEPPPANSDMGGADFGVSDGSSWDDGGGGGGGGADLGGGDFGSGGGDSWT
ncbi:MAG TPA: hypothetical protein VMU67_06565 [Steroidobacteraceae bacterium]|nr:hypothetical protein [Steroidobacteraceae bacterium]